MPPDSTPPDSFFKKMLWLVQSVMIIPPSSPLLSSLLSSRFQNDLTSFLDLYLVVTIVCRRVTFSDRPLRVRSL